MKRFGAFCRLITAVAFLFACSCLVKTASTDLNLSAQLIWGTNNEKPDDPKLKEITPEVGEKLRGVFKWKNYFEVNRQNFKVSSAGTKRVKMSEHCEIEVQNLGSSAVEVKLYGKGKLVVKKRQVIKPAELLVLAGDDKNDTAWFVVLTVSNK
jgi:hypothetical protein